MTRKTKKGPDAVSPVEQAQGWRNVDPQARAARVNRRLAREAAEQEAADDEIDALVVRGNRLRGQ